MAQNLNTVKIASDTGGMEKTGCVCALGRLYNVLVDPKSTWAESKARLQCCHSLQQSTSSL